ncbi:SbcC/MukB-like Walker B domain-containing protein [Pseudoxanthomonas sp.]|uniref:SbcC/MukB-like Walker B domain-containing protein n=1 Tax=Pseudoxanthomonas sp. TaxID=1871049 RepID=UPI0026051FE3|nr:SbcC/MukB-like Walker B domain-containing protein [Pseudoxanthomonas sp.]WDS36888.1 MAG: SbcC/MukB-like Walker B domain-containing protein [Pseudoxanthomonas sp.]
MQLLERVHLVQFFLFEAQTLQLDPTSAIIAPNGAGKSALLDALQIVLLGADRSRIRFNAQAGGSSRARSIRDYCLGVYRSGDEGRKRRTATTYISLVFRDQETGEPLTAGIALGASVDEPDHRVHGLYLLPGVALALEDHLERVDGKTLPLAWASFRELGARLCKQAGTKQELHTTSERFLKDLLFRLRASPTLHPDLGAYRKAFSNALNLQKHEDIDLFVRTLVAEDRPTEIARFRALLETFRQIKDKIEQVARRIEVAEKVDEQYGKIAAQAERAASSRALEAEYRRDLLGEQVEQADQQLARAAEELSTAGRVLQEARSGRSSARQAYEQAQQRLQGTHGFADQASFDAIAGRDRDQLVQRKKDLIRQLAYVRDQLQAVAGLKLDALDPTALAEAVAPWQQWLEELGALAGDSEIPLSPEALHAQALAALKQSAPILGAVAQHARLSHAAWEEASARRDSARRNQGRVSAGQSELRPDVVRLMNYLHDEGIEVRPVCDLVRITDTSWQPAIEAYLRSHVEALLVPAEHEERATRLVRSLQGGRAVYGVKLALSTHARAGRAEHPAVDAVASLIAGDNAEAVAYLRRQLGELRQVDSDQDVVRTRQGLTRDGLVAKGGGIERRRLPAASELKIGATDSRERLRSLREELETAEQDVRRLEPAYRQAEALQQALSRFADADEVALSIHDGLLQHKDAEARYRITRESHAAQLDPDLVQLSEQVRELQARAGQFDLQIEQLAGKEAVAQGNRDAAERLLAALRSQEEFYSRNAVAAFNDPDVNPNRVERQREELDEKLPSLEDRVKRCEERARDADRQLAALVPAAWSELAQYAKDHGSTFDFAADAWRPAQGFLKKELDHLRGTELAQYQAQAAEAYGTAVETFRTNVASTLYDNFSKLRHQINTLNRTLRSSPAFSNNERYQFHFEVIAEYQELHRFIQRAADLNGEDGLFGTAGEVPAAFHDLIEDSAQPRMAASPLDDYRRFFKFEVQIKQDDRVIGTLSERMRSGSGGEHRAPLYVIAGAALAAAYGKSDAHPGGMGLILLDEFGDKIDAQNARATTNYLRSLGLQLVLAAPDTAQGTLSGVMDSYIELFRDGDLLQVERIEVKAAARELLLSDQFDLHPELLAAETDRINAERNA